MHPAKAVGRNVMPFGRDTHAEEPQSPPREGKIWGWNPQFAAMAPITNFRLGLFQENPKIGKFVRCTIVSDYGPGTSDVWNYTGWPKKIGTIFVRLNFTKY